MLQFRCCVTSAWLSRTVPLIGRAQSHKSGSLFLCLASQRALTNSSSSTTISRPLHLAKFETKTQRALSRERRRNELLASTGSKSSRPFGFRPGGNCTQTLKLKRQLKRVLFFQENRFCLSLALELCPARLCVVTVASPQWHFTWYETWTKTDCSVCKDKHTHFSAGLAGSGCSPR